MLLLLLLLQHRFVEYDWNGGKRLCRLDRQVSGAMWAPMAPCWSIRTHETDLFALLLRV